MKKWSAYLLALSIVTFSISTVGYVAAQSKATWTIKEPMLTTALTGSWTDMSHWLWENLDQSQVTAFETKFFPTLPISEQVEKRAAILFTLMKLKADPEEIAAAEKALADTQAKMPTPLAAESVKTP